MEFFSKLLFYVSAPHCVACDSLLEYGDRAICKSCEIQFSKEKAGQCSNCFRDLPECSCVNPYLSSHSVKSLHKVFRYRPSSPERVSNLLVFALKKSHRRDVISRTASECAESLRRSGVSLNDAVFVPVPRSRGSIRKYGYDQSYALAKELSDTFSVDFCDCLLSNVKKLQKETTGEERMKNPDFYVRNEDIDLSGKTVFLVDDVVTTGATMGQAALLVRSLGAKTVRGVCLGIAMKDNSR